MKFEAADHRFMLYIKFVARRVRLGKYKDNTKDMHNINYLIGRKYY